MNAYTDRNPEDTGRQRAASRHAMQGRDAAFAFVDARAGAAAQGRLQELVATGVPLRQARAVQAMADNSSRSAAMSPLTQLMSEHGDASDRGAIPQRGNLPAPLKRGVERLSGLSMEDVNVHYASAAPARLSAHAYAQGSEIYLAPGQERHLPHEAWHVVQQKQGRVRATRQMKGGVAINDDRALEAEADVMGARALAAGAAPDTVAASLGGMAGRSLSGQEPMQFWPDDDDEQAVGKPAFARQIAPYAHAGGTVLNSLGFALLTVLARRPIYARASREVFHRGMVRDFLMLKTGILSTMVGSHLMGGQDVIGAWTRGTAYQVQPRLTADQDKANYGLGLAQTVAGLSVGQRALMARIGVGGFAVANLGLIPPLVLMAMLLSSGTSLMGKEGPLAEIVRTRRGHKKEEQNFPHSKSKEAFSDLLSQVLFPASLGVMGKAAFAANMGFFARRRMMGLGAAGMFTASALSPVSSTIPMLLGGEPDPVTYSPAENPLDASRTIIGLGSVGVGFLTIWKTLSPAEKLGFLTKLRWGMYGSSALFGGLGLLQVLPILYYHLKVPEPGVGAPQQGGSAEGPARTGQDRAANHDSTE